MKRFLFILVSLLCFACGGASERDECSFDFGKELEGQCSARGYEPSFDGCEAIACGAFECRDGERTVAIDRDSDGTASVTVIVPAPESIARDRLFCWSLYAVR